MKSTGIVRPVDSLGRIVLPIEIRRNLDIEVRDQVEIFLDGDRIVLQKYEPACVFCGSGRGTLEFKGKRICQSCVQAIEDL